MKSDLTALAALLLSNAFLLQTQAATAQNPSPAATATRRGTCVWQRELPGRHLVRMAESVLVGWAASILQFVSAYAPTAIRQRRRRTAR